MKFQRSNCRIDVDHSAARLLGGGDDDDPVRDEERRRERAAARARARWAAAAAQQQKEKMQTLIGSLTTEVAELRELLRGALDEQARRMREQSAAAKLRKGLRTVVAAVSLARAAAPAAPAAADAGAPADAAAAAEEAEAEAASAEEAEAAAFDAISEEVQQRVGASFARVEEVVGDLSRESQQQLDGAKASVARQVQDYRRATDADPTEPTLLELEISAIEQRANNGALVRGLAQLAEAEPALAQALQAKMNDAGIQQPAEDLDADDDF